MEHPEVFAVDDEFLGVLLQLSKESFFFLIKHCTYDNDKIGKGNCVIRQQGNIQETRCTIDF